MGVGRRRGFCIAFLVMILLNINCCGAASLKVNSTTSWCNGSVDECLTMDLDFDLFMGSEIGRMLAAITFVTPGSGNGGKQAVPGPKGTSYANNLPPPNGGASKCGAQKRDCKKVYKKPK